MSDLEADGTLLTDGGHKIPQMTITAPMLLDRTIAIYGPSGTGKTVLTKHLMKVAQPHIDQILIVSPSEPTNKSYAGFVDPTLIHYSLGVCDYSKDPKDTPQKAAMRFLNDVWKRQEMLAGVYAAANDVKVLASLFGRLPKDVRARSLAIINDINAKREKINAQVRRMYAAEPGRCDEKVKEVNEKFRKMLALIYKQAIVPHYEELYGQADLSDEELYSLSYIKLNPRLLLIFDDCAAQLKPFFSKDIFRLLFYQNRHSYITVIICCQDDTDLPTNLRKNAFISLFTEAVVCRSNFDRGSNHFPKPVKTFVADVVGDVFKGVRKMAYMRDDPRRKNFYHVSVPYPQPFQFGSSALLELCKEVRSSGVAMDAGNPYFDRFRLESRGPASRHN